MINPKLELANGEETLLNLNYKKLKTIPAAVLQMKELRGLFLKRNILEALPPDISNLRKLKIFYADSNEIKELPNEFLQLHKLEDLSLAGNKIMHLPEGIGKLQSLVNLNVSLNMLSVVPNGIIDLVNMKTLNLVQNKLTCLPHDIGLCSNLESLDLDCNNLSELPTTIVCLRKLKHLSVSKNKLTYIPFDMDRLQSLETFIFDANPALHYLPIKLFFNNKLKLIGDKRCFQNVNTEEADTKAFKEFAFPATVRWCDGPTILSLSELCCRCLCGVIESNPSYKQSIKQSTRIEDYENISYPLGKCYMCKRNICRLYFTALWTQTFVLRKLHPSQFDIDYNICDMEIIQNMDSRFKYFVPLCDWNCYQAFINYQNVSD